MQDFRRYAIFWAPPAGSALARFGAAWLGWDADAGVDVAHPPVGVDVSAVTETPRKYGFHGTLKPPFRLAAGTDLEGLDRGIAALAGETPAFHLPGLTLRALGDFAALVPVGRNPDLAALAGACVKQLDHFRTVATETELVRRRAKGLSDRQENLLQRWGYPYVLEEFRFHLTLTGRLKGDAKSKVLEILQEITREHTGKPVEISEIYLFGEGMDGRFRIINRYALTG